jgi:hypothetical protein
MTKVDDSRYRPIFSVCGVAHANKSNVRTYNQYWEYARCLLQAYYDEEHRQASIEDTLPDIMDPAKRLVMDDVPDPKHVSCFLCLVAQAQAR